ncbi:MAG: ribonuclease E/G [Acetobacteraceae bacterium]
MTVRVLADASPGEVRVAAADGTQLLDYAIWRPGAPDGVDDLHRARVITRVPAMAGAFVAFADAEGFLPDSAGGEGLSDGTVLPVRITRAAQGGKGPRVTARLNVEERDRAGSGPPGLVQRGPGAVERLAALYPQALVLVNDGLLATELRSVLGMRVSFDSSTLLDDLEPAPESLAEPVASVGAGGRLHIQPTSALVAIDVDIGSGTGERRSKAAAQVAFNRAVLPVLAQQIRLRNLSGPILVDLAGLSVRRRAMLADDLAGALSGDPLRPRFLGFSALGLAEILRPRVHPPLHELLAGPHATGLVALRCIAEEVAAQPALRPILRAAPKIVAAVQADPVALPDLARRMGRPLILRADPGMTGWRMETADG